jgi:hypothetical protein
VAPWFNEIFIGAWKRGASISDAPLELLVAVQSAVNDLHCALLEDLLGQVVMNLGLVLEHFEIRAL